LAVVRILAIAAAPALTNNRASSLPTAGNSDFSDEIFLSRFGCRWPLNQGLCSLTTGDKNEIELYDKARIDLAALVERRRKLREGIREDVELAELRRLAQEVPALNT
jgi:hypothetical protein